MAEYEVPPRAVPDSDAGYFEKITQAVFQSGFSWQVIRSKWPNFQQAFAGFDVETVARFSDEDLERLVEDKGIVRNGRKIKATITNAQLCRDIIREHVTFHAYLRGLDGQDYESRSKKLCKQFKFMGPMGAYFFFWSVGEDVPEYHEWRAQQNK
ncbi:MAG: DNA-3-methyladenine glycosylase I [Chloroflexi bacterium]|nr:MAG: DNA-3-methyladenine glycosylase I [Chloroflexota bacterium]